ncbi:unnamed protein product [Moneuplotes crassus]|uniref:Uncharacterized protein n=1 Tax=Euplotes crassus TaxID=5936 RepID=A0AAD1X984_EUPCR|nr:unnamed protein product [Moneuplotes crassus]
MCCLVSLRLFADGRNVSCAIEKVAICGFLSICDKERSIFNRIFSWHKSFGGVIFETSVSRLQDWCFWTSRVLRVRLVSHASSWELWNTCSALSMSKLSLVFKIKVHL